MILARRIKSLCVCWEKRCFLCDCYCFSFLRYSNLDVCHYDAVLIDGSFEIGDHEPFYGEIIQADLFLSKMQLVCRIETGLKIN